MIITLFLILFFSCAEVFISEEDSYKSVYLNGDAWIEIENSLLEFYSYNNVWESEPGKFHVFIGSDSNVREHKEFYLTD